MKAFVISWLYALLPNTPRGMLLLLVALWALVGVVGCGVVQVVI